MAPPAFDTRAISVVVWKGVNSDALKEHQVLEVLHTVLMIAQVFVALALIAVVMTQTNKDQGMGGALSGQNADASRYKGGYEEKMDNLAKNLAFWFLGLSFAVAVFAHIAG